MASSSCLFVRKIPQPSIASTICSIGLGWLGVMIIIIEGSSIPTKILCQLSGSFDYSAVVFNCAACHHRWNCSNSRFRPKQASSGIGIHTACIQELLTKQNKQRLRMTSLHHTHQTVLLLEDGLCGSLCLAAPASITSSKLSPVAGYSAVVSCREVTMNIVRLSEARGMWMFSSLLEQQCFQHSCSDSFPHNIIDWSDDQSSFFKL